MKRLFLLVLALVLPLSAVWGDDLNPDQRWTESIDGSFSFPFSTADAQAFAPGLGGDLSMGYRFDRNFTLSAATGYYQYNVQNQPGSTANLSYIPLLAVARYNLMTGPVHPYIFLGAGVALNTFTLNSSTLGTRETDFLLTPGLGVLFRVADFMGIFFQGRVDIDFTSTGGLGKSTDSPSIFIPLQVGVGFFVL
jgi:hypothetical protein